MTRKTVAWFAAAAVVIAAAIGMRLTFPWTKLQCYVWAAERKTSDGIRLATEVCYRRFGSL
jgi:hypothetical protein